MESIHNSLGLSQENLEGATSENRAFARAIMAQAIAFADFAADQKKNIQQEIAAGIAQHVRVCTGEDPSAPGGAGSGKLRGTFIVQAQRKLLSNAMALSLFLSVCVLKFGDKLFDSLMLAFGVSP